MKVHLTFRHLEPTDGLKQYTEGKLEKIEKFLTQGPHKVNVIYSLVRYVHRVDLTLFEKNHVFKAEGATNDMYASVDQAMHSLEQQLQRYKGKIKHHKNYFKSHEGRLAEATDIFDRRLQKERDTNRVWKQENKPGYKKKAS